MKEIKENSLLSQWKQRLKDVAPTLGISKVPDDTPLVPSHGQQRLWFLQQLNPENPFYNHSEVYVFKGNLEVENLKRAIQLLYDTHDVLRSTYQIEDGLLLLMIGPKSELKIQEHDLSTLIESEAADREAEITCVDARTPFDLINGPLIRVSLIKRNDNDHLLFLTLHHIVGDKWSLEVFNKQLAKYYGKLCSKEQDVIESLPIQFQDFAYWQMQKQLDNNQLDYWTDKLSGEIPHLDLPKDFKPPLQTSYKGANISSDLGTELSTEILSLSKDLGTTPYVLMLSVYFVLLHRYTGQNDILIGSPISNRDQQILENLMGFFNDTVVLRTQLDSEMSFRELITILKDTTLEAFQNKDVPFEELVKALKPQRSLSANPFFQVMFLYNSVETLPEFGTDLNVASETYDSGTSKFDLTLFISEVDGKLTSSFEYSTDLFEESTIKRLQQHLKLLLKGITKNLDLSIAKIPMLTDFEEKLFYPDISLEHAEQEELKKPIHRFIEAIAKENPSKRAVIFKNESISYGEINRKANNIARPILDKTKEKNEIVGLCMDRSLNMMISMLAILKSGCAYLPIDPDYPKKRIEFMFSDAEVNLVLTETSQMAMIENHDVDCLNIDDIETDQIIEGFAMPDVQPSDTAYVIYTSGSTGRPKGVPISHKNIVNSTLGRTEFYGHNPTSFLLLSSIAFDSSKAGIYWTLCTGGTLIISEKRMEQDMALMSKTIQENQVSHTLMLPSLYNLLLDYAISDELQSLITVMVAGEACSNRVCIQHFETLPDVGLYNEYGPTEATVWCVAHKIEQDDIKGSVPIGKPVANAVAHILDDNLANVPYGCVGELCISGLGLTKGYIKLPADNAERFVQIPLKPDSNSTIKIYRTGDLARYGRNGNIEFLGRKDQQVKVRGFRIELDEIEKAILNNDLVEKAVIVIESANKKLDYSEFSTMDTDQLLDTIASNIELEELDEILKSVENLGDMAQDFLSKKL